MNITDYFKTYWYVGLAIILVCIGVIVYNVITSKKRKAANTVFLAEHPDAAKIYLVKSVASAAAGTVQVYTVNGAHAQMFSEKTKTGFYVVPGENSISASFSYTRPGVVSRTVTKTWGPTTVTVNAEPNKSYFLGFDRKAENFKLEDM
jgi:hypothetical protein